MTAPVEYTTPLAQVRLLTADLDPQNPMLNDDIINGYLALNNGSVYRAAADALDAMATSEVILSRKIRTQDLATDGPAVAAELRKKASDLRLKADSMEVVDSSHFEFISPYSSRGEAAETSLHWGIW